MTVTLRLPTVPTLFEAPVVEESEGMHTMSDGLKTGPVYHWKVPLEM